MDPELMRAAAVKRCAQVRSRADRPSKRHNNSGLDDYRVHARLVEPSFVEERAESGLTLLRFTGYASVTDTPYEMYDWYGPYEETVESGAFTETLKQLGLDVPLVLQHEDLRRIARTTIRPGERGALSLTEDQRGLRVEGLLDPADADVAYIVPKVLSGLIDEMSFKFRILEGWWSEDFTQFVIKKVDIHRGDVAIVGYGANPHTVGLDVSEGQRSAPPASIRGCDVIADDDVAMRV